MLKVEAAVKEVFSNLSPRDDVTMPRFSEMTLEVRKRVEGATESDRHASRWLQYLLPPRDQEDFVLKESDMTAESAYPDLPNTLSTGITPLRRLIDETSDLIDSPPFSHVLTMLLDAGFSTLVDKKIAQQAFKIPEMSEVTDLDAPRITEVFDIKPVKLPIVLAILTKQAHKIGNGVPNEYLQAMEQVRDLEGFAAVVYSSNWESEMSPLSNDGGVGSTPRDDSEIVATSLQPSGANLSGEDSVIDIGTASTFESVWGKAVETLEKPSTL